MAQQKPTFRTTFALPQQIFSTTRNGLDRRSPYAIREVGGYWPAQAAFAHDHLGHALAFDLRQQSKARRLDFREFGHD